MFIGHFHECGTELNLFDSLFPFAEPQMNVMNKSFGVDRTLMFYRRLDGNNSVVSERLEQRDDELVEQTCRVVLSAIGSLLFYFCTS